MLNNTDIEMVFLFFHLLVLSHSIIQVKGTLLHILFLSIEVVVSIPQLDIYTCIWLLSLQ